MPPTKFWPIRRPRAPRSTPPDAAASSASAAIAPSDHTDPPIPQLSEALQPAYPDYVHGGASGPRWDAALALPSILADLRTLPPGLAGPLSQIPDILSGTVEAVKLMRENKEACAHLVSRVTKLFRSLINSMMESNASFGEGTATAASLVTLMRYIFLRRCTCSMLNPFWR